PHCQEALRRRLDEQAEHLQPFIKADDTPTRTLDETGPPLPLLERLRQLPLVSRARLLAEPARTTPEPTAPALPGYEVLGVLGRGGMGVVYQARDLRLKRMVALKMVLAGAHAAAEEHARFRREAEAVARLQHPNIVQVYEVGEQDGVPYLALEHVGGGT